MSLGRARAGGIGPGPTLPPPGECGLITLDGRSNVLLGVRIGGHTHDDLTQAQGLAGCRDEANAPSVGGALECDVGCVPHSGVTHCWL